MTRDPLSFLNHKNYGIYNRQIAAKFGLTCAVILAELIEKREYHSSRNELISDSKNGEGWFYHTLDSMQERTGIFRKEQDACLKKLIKENLIEIKVFGLPAKRHFKLNDDKILEFFDLSKKHSSLDEKTNWIGQKDKLECPQGQTAPYIYNTKEEPKENTQINSQEEKCVFGSHVKMKKQEYTELESKISKPVLDDLIEQINDYCASHGKNYKDYAATIRSWHKRKKDDPTVKSKSVGVNFKSELEKLGFQNGGIYNNILLEIDDKGICFYLGTAQSKIEFNEQSFMDKFRNFCEKQNIQFLKKQAAYGT